MADHFPVHLKAKLAQIPDLWAPRVVAQLNDYHIKIARIQGEFVWHSHPETDELFLIVQGELTIQLRDGEVTLREGELFVVPRGVEHRPIAAEECHILLVEPAGTVNTGDTGGGRTAPADVWI
jgi:mannose-6-phosphate isomerase-like protein (cupin superfamily)